MGLERLLCNFEKRPCQRLDWCRSAAAQAYGLQAVEQLSMPIPLAAAPPQDLRHRLWDKLPASSQPRQATPYLGAC